jgi:ketosteroid isomerase-like protein
MKKVFHLPFVLLVLCLVACGPFTDNEKSKTEIIQTEKDFAKTVKDKGIAVAFYTFADTNAVIKRGPELVKGITSISAYYFSHPQKGELEWTPEFADASGELGYTYGPYTYSEKDSTGNTVVAKGYFHTVWKKQKNGTWKFVWD